MDEKIDQEIKNWKKACIVLCTWCLKMLLVQGIDEAMFKQSLVQIMNWQSLEAFYAWILKPSWRHA